MKQPKLSQTAAIHFMKDSGYEPTKIFKDLKPFELPEGYVYLQEDVERLVRSSDIAVSEDLIYMPKPRI